MKQAALPPAPFAALGLDQFGVAPFDGALLTVPCRARARVPAGARSVVAAAFPYYVGAFPHRNVSRYAMVDDYHAVAGALLGALCGALAERFPREAFVPFIDNSPFDEVALARRAGLGVRGRNGQLINPRYGSYLFIGEIVTTADLLPAAPAPDAGCAACGRCAAACPAGAVGARAEDFRRDRCLSHLTQKKHLDGAQADAVRRGGFAWGCDVCADVCPMNRGARYSPIAAFYRNIRAVVTHNNWESGFAGRAWAWRGRAVLERNLRLIEEKGQSLWK